MHQTQICAAWSDSEAIMFGPLNSTAVFLSRLSPLQRQLLQSLATLAQSPPRLLPLLPAPSVHQQSLTLRPLRLLQQLLQSANQPQSRSPKLAMNKSVSLFSSQLRAALDQQSLESRLVSQHLLPPLLHKEKLSVANWQILLALIVHSFTG